MKTTEPKLRLIAPQDNLQVKALVLETLAEFGLFGDGYAGADDELDDMFSAYANKRSAYYVIAEGDAVLGVGGYAPLVGDETGGVAELRKMYFHPTLRGQGWGQKLIEKCLTSAQQDGFQSMYLETVPTMQAAQALYAKNGFTVIKERLGNTGHNSCDVCMFRRLL